MTSNISKRLAALEAQLGEHEKIIPLIFPDWACAGSPTAADLAAPPDADGCAWISQYYSVKFWGGTPAGWQEELDQLRADPQYQGPKQSEGTGKGSPPPPAPADQGTVSHA